MDGWVGGWVMIQRVLLFSVNSSIITTAKIGTIPISRNGVEICLLSSKISSSTSVAAGCEPKNDTLPDRFAPF